MKTILQILPSGAKVVDKYGNIIVDTPEIMLHTSVVLEFDLRSEERVESGELDLFSPEKLNITGWYFALDCDFDHTTSLKILITEGIRCELSEGRALLKIPIANTGTAELVADMNGAASKRYTAEIGGLDANANMVATWQFQMTVKNRIFAGENAPAPPEVTTPEYYNAMQINSLLNAKADVGNVYSKTDIDSMLGNIEQQLAEI
ncbi:MAG: hypothetical protein IKC77_08785 [Lentisphaeria bacterium]|nr:hypothetical protein [Lentisphaeria bacterium]